MLRLAVGDGTQAAIGKILASVSAGHRLLLLGRLENEHIVRLCRARVEFDPRNEEEITEQMRARLRASDLDPPRQPEFSVVAAEARVA